MGFLGTMCLQWKLQLFKPVLDQQVETLALILAKAQIAFFFLCFSFVKVFSTEAVMEDVGILLRKTKHVAVFADLYEFNLVS